MPHRFEGVDIDILTIKNFHLHLPKSLVRQIEMFLPPEGSFDDESLRRYVKVIRDFEVEERKRRIHQKERKLYDMEDEVLEKQRIVRRLQDRVSDFMEIQRREQESGVLSSPDLQREVLDTIVPLYLTMILINSSILVYYFF